MLEIDNKIPLELTMRIYCRIIFGNVCEKYLHTFEKRKVKKNKNRIIIVRFMKPVVFNNTVLRDGHQSLAATRMPTEMMLPACPILDSMGFGALETALWSRWFPSDWSRCSNRTYLVFSTFEKDKKIF